MVKQTKKKKPGPELELLGERVGRCWASGHPLLFHISCCPQMSFRTISLRRGRLGRRLVGEGTQGFSPHWGEFLILLGPLDHLKYLFQGLNLWLRPELSYEDKQVGGTCTQRKYTLLGQWETWRWVGRNETNDYFSYLLRRWRMSTKCQNTFWVSTQICSMKKEISLIFLP